MGKWRYGVVLDAGSSGTRVHIYRWLHSAVAQTIATEEDRHRLPRVSTKKKWTLKVKPGISTFGENPEDVGSDHLKELFKHALDVVPKSQVADTPLFLLATAGMRLLPPTQKQAILKEVCDYARRKTDFLLPDCDLHIQVISGETEGLYGWIAANYLVGGFDQPQEHQHGDNHHTYGFLDMGGASAQIAFAPNATESEKHANDLQLLRFRTIDGLEAEYRVFVTTWLGYGVNEARRRYIESLMDSVDLAQTNLLPDPCLPKGLEVKKDGSIIESGSDEEQGLEPYLLGTGRFPECLAQTLPLLDKNAACDDPPCLFHGVHVPAIDFHVNHFIGISEYWHTTHEIFEMGHSDKAYDFLTYQNRVKEFCSQEWSSITNSVDEDIYGKKVDEERAAAVCFKASWIISVLHEGIGVPRVGIETGSEPQGQNGTEAVIEAAEQGGYLAPFQAINKVDGTEISWTLGKIVLYAASQVPPANDEVLAVGFGSNVQGIPANFQYAGGSPDTIIPADVNIAELLEDINDLDDDYLASYTEDTDDDAVILDSRPTLVDSKPSLLSSDNLSRRLPGLILFILIAFLIAFLLCGRDRRQNLQHKFTKLFRRRKHGDGSFSSMRQQPRDRKSRFPFSLGSSRKGKYERVTDGHDAEIPPTTDVELGTLSSSSDDDAASIGSRVSASPQARRGTRSGTVTPRSLRSVSPPRVQNGGYFGSAALSGASTAQGFDQGGLGPRIGSRERLDRMNRGVVYDGGGSAGPLSYSALGLGTGLSFPAGKGSRSRAGSPTRWKSPLLTPLKENVD